MTASASGTQGQPGLSRVISILTDYGRADGFVGVVHSVLRQRLPTVPLVDLTHEIAPYDVRAGSLALARAAPYLAAGVVMAVVDPGVGTSRRGVAAQTAPDITFVGPDNGLLGPALDVLGGATVAVELEDRGYWLRSPGPTFAGRDVFAPAAAHLAAGGAIDALGPLIETATLVRLPRPLLQLRDAACLETEVTWIDHFGNVQLAARPGDIPATIAALDRLAVIGTPATTLAPDGELLTARRVQVFADLSPGELGLIVDSYGHLALCLYAASAAERIGAREQDRVALAVPPQPQNGAGS